MNGNLGRTQEEESWPILMYYRGIFLERLNSHQRAEREQRTASGRTIRTE